MRCIALHCIAPFVVRASNRLKWLFLFDSVHYTAFIIHRISLMYPDINTYLRIEIELKIGHEQWAMSFHLIWITSVTKTRIFPWKLANRIVNGSTSYFVYHTFAHIHSVARATACYYEYIFHTNAVHARICGNKMRSNVSGFVELKIQNSNSGIRTLCNGCRIKCIRHMDANW